MDKSKLDVLAEKLLDTGKRSNLVNFKDSKSSTVEILLPSMEALFAKIEGTTTFEVFDPKIEDQEDLLSPDFDTHSKENFFEVQSKDCDPKTTYFNQYSPKIKKQNQILLYSPEASPLTALRKIDKKAKKLIEEAGVNVAFIAFGFIHWTENENSKIEHCAPLLLAPITLKQESIISPYTIRSTGDDILVNPTFSFILDNEYGIKLPDYATGSYTTLGSYISEVESSLKKLRWSVTDECKIGIFAFQKISMYLDLKNNADIILQNNNIRWLLGEQVNHTDLLCDEYQHVKNPLIELHSVVDADSSQIEAIELAKAGKSFVLQGPPGTGKSQTITNIIAECLSDGKKVLFVSEKLAALNVVYDKLKQANLSEFCLELHSQKANKKDVIADICNTLQKQRSSLSSSANEEILQKEVSQRALDNYARELHEIRPVIERSLYGLYERFSSLSKYPLIDWPIEDISTKNENYLLNAESLLKNYADYIPSIGYDYKKHPWYGFKRQDISYEGKHEIKFIISNAISYINKVHPLCNDIAKHFEISTINSANTMKLQPLLQLLAESTIITPSLINPDIFDTVRQTLARLQEMSPKIAEFQNKFEKDYNPAIYNIDAAGYYKNLTENYSSFFNRLYDPEYKEIVTAIKSYSLKNKKPNYSKAVDLTKELIGFQRKYSEYLEVEKPIQRFVGSSYIGARSNWEYINDQLDQLQKIIDTKVDFGKLDNRTLEHMESERSLYANLALRISEVVEPEYKAYQYLLDLFDDSFYDFSKTDDVAAIEKLSFCLEEFDSLDNWYGFRDILNKIYDQGLLPFVDILILKNEKPELFAPIYKKQFYFQWIDKIITSSPTLMRFNRVVQENTIKAFSEKDVEQFEINKAIIRSSLSSQRPALDLVSQGSGVQILLRQGQLKTRQKSIRSLLLEVGDIVQRIKPCFMMSPLSVSTFLESKSIHFDVVIFDEASQIFPQDAIGAIYRADQLIVVGDSKQMPPTDFFNASSDNEGYDEDDEDIADFESILDLCIGAAMKTNTLCWHYRSKYEQLISFSNKNFYNGTLVTFPSAKADAIGVGIDYYHVDGIFNSRKNIKEAEFIIDLIYDNINKYPDRSLGVVAFSREQQDIIDKLLQKRRLENPRKESFFSLDKKEPFFIKNLESVQGDERDSIIFSVAYGPNPQGQIFQRFGPLSKLGGERRLNVAVTRAKCNIQIVSSMHYTDIDLSRAKSDGARLLREYLDFAENGEIALERAVSLNIYEEYDSDFEMEVCSFLRLHGYSVDTQVGCSGFRIDLGLKKPDSSDYVLAIECDGATYHSSRNARDRDRLRQEILERMGWKFYRIWSTDWFRNKSVEQKRLLEAAEKAIQSTDNDVKIMPSSSDEAASNKQFEMIVNEPTSSFPKYQKARTNNLSYSIPIENNKTAFQRNIKYILSVEAPMTEDFILKEMSSFFGSQKVTTNVRNSFRRSMVGCEKFGIIKDRYGAYTLSGKEPVFRAPGTNDYERRAIKYIPILELAAGMREIIKQNGHLTKKGLYQKLAHECGCDKVGTNISDIFDQALQSIRAELVIDGDIISLR